MNYYLQRIFSKAKVQRQLYTIFFIAFFIPVGLIGIFLLMNTLFLLNNHYESLVESDNLKVKSIMFDVTTNFCNLSEEIANDQELKRILNTQYSTMEDAKAACSSYIRFGTILQNETSVSTLNLYTLNTTIPGYENIKPVTEEIRNSNWFDEARKRPDFFWKTQERIDKYNNSYLELTLYRKIPLIENGDYAILCMTMSDNYLKNRIENNTLFTQISVNRENVFYSTTRNYAGKKIAVPIDYEQEFFHDTGRMEFDSVRSVKEKQFPTDLFGNISNKSEMFKGTSMGAVSSLKPYRTNDTLYIATIDFSAIPHMKKISINNSIILVLTVLLPFLFISLFAKYFSARVGTLRSAMHKASNQNFDIMDSFQGDDELSETFSDLKVMIHKIKEKDARMYESKITEQQLMNQQQKMEFKMLASQINPHFLYNTLETIRMMAFTAGNRDVATAAKLLGKSMRYVLENTGTASVTLEKELNYIETYLSIQKLRFEERISYQLKVQSGLTLSDYQILPLLLQPIVENAILHGLENEGEQGCIFIHVSEKEEEILFIDIFDNGTGMTKEELENLTNRIATQDITTTTSIGLYNINQRIRLYYGSSYGMKIKSRKAIGTLVSLLLPLHNTQGE